MKSIDYKDCTNITECAERSIEGLAEIYWKEYPEYIRQLPSILKNCESYRELGTNQGGSASVALLQKLKYYELIDKSFKNFNPIKKYFDEYTKENNIEICYREMSSLEVNTIVKTDFILIDSVHKYNHVTKEIKKYEPLTKKYMMFHDTISYPGVREAVISFLTENKHWKIVEEQTVTPGYIVLGRINEK